MLPKAHLTSHSRMSGSGWVTTLSCLFGSIRSFLYSYCMYSFHLFLIFLISITPTRSLLFLSSVVPIFGWNAPLIFSTFLKRTLVVFHLCFPLFLCIVEWRRPSCLSLLFSETLFSWVTDCLTIHIVIHLKFLIVWGQNLHLYSSFWCGKAFPTVENACL